MRGIWLRWSWRDFRARWLQILATALILGVGIGAFAGLVGLREWRERSADLSLAAMREHDVRVDLAEGAFVPGGRLWAAIGRLPAGTVIAAEERLVAGGQLDASRPGRPVLVPARVIGVPVTPGGDVVDRVTAIEGRRLGERDAFARVAVLDWNFGKHYDLPPTGRVRLAGLGSVRYVGLGVIPQHLLVVSDSGVQGAEAALGIVYMPLAAAQRAAGHPGKVNQLVLRFAPGRDARAEEPRLAAALAAALGNRGFTITRGDEEAPQRILYRDARNDQQLYLVMAVLLLAGAAFATFNLVNRVVEAQRREIGIGMALGVEPWQLAIRPLLLGTQIAVLGIVLGLPIGTLLAELIKSLMKSFFPLPAHASTFPTELYLLAAALGVIVPLAAAALPVRRAIGVQPVEAIRVGHRAAKGAGAAAALRRLVLPGGSVAQLPVRNLARTPRRTLLTLLGLGAVMTAVVAVLGMIDAISRTAEQERAELLRTSPGRLLVELGAPVPADGPALARLRAVPGVRSATGGLTVESTVRTGKTSIDVALSFVGAGAPWRPSTPEGRLGGPGIVLARKAADDLGVSVGDSVRLRHPRRAGAALTMVETRARVTGIHGSPVRAHAFADAAWAPRLGLGGIVTTATVVPAPGARPESIQRALFGAPGIASVRAVRTDADALMTALDAFEGAIRIVVAFTLAMALLVAFTSTSVSLDERRREFATMFAFGLPPRSGLRVAMTESVITGVLGTAVGLALGFATTGWVVSSLLPQVFPDLGAEVAVTAGSLLTTLAVGIGAVAVAPLLTYRRMRAMDLPATLRVVE